MFNNNNTLIVRSEDHILPECFQFGTKANSEAKEVMDTVGFIGALATGAFSAFSFLCQADDFLSKKSAKQRANNSSWF